MKNRLFAKQHCNTGYGMPLTMPSTPYWCVRQM